MKKNECKFKSKYLAILLCAFLPLQGVSLEVDENTSREIPLVEADLSEEIASLSMSPLLEQSVTPIAMPDPFLTLDFHPVKSSFIAVGLSTLIPGFGHVYLGDPKTAGSLIGVAGLSVCGATFLKSKEISFLTLQNTWAYGV